MWDSDAAADLALQRHLLQAQFADRLLGELLDRLDELDLYDDALVVVTADHGASFVPGTHRRLPEEETLPGIMPVPLVVKLPASTPADGHRDDRPAETVDILPTLADALEVEVPWPLDGTSLLGPAPEPHERAISAEGDTTTTDADPIDLSEIVARIRRALQRGRRPPALRPGRGRRADRRGRRRPDGRRGRHRRRAGCGPMPVEGTGGWVGGHLEGATGHRRPRR